MSLYGLQSFQFGLAREATRGTAESAPAKWYPIIAPEAPYGPNHLPDQALRGVRAEYAPVAGRKTGTGKFKMVLDSQAVGEFLYSLMGAVSSNESSEVTIDGTNNKLDFNIGAGELTATIPSASYPIGLTQATVGSLCKAIYDAIVAAEAVGTYTVSYSRTTKLFTITRSAGTFQLLRNTGTNVANSIWTTIGFTTAANSTGALTYSGSAQVEYVFKHDFSIGTSIQPPAYTFFFNWGLQVKKYNGACVKALTFTGPVDNLITVDVEFLFRSEADGSIGSPSFPVQRYMSFQHADFKRAGSSDTDVKSWTLKIDNMAKAHQTLALSQDIQDVVAPDPMTVTGDLVVFFQSETERAKFLANTDVALRALIQHSVISGSFYWAVDLPITAAKYKAYPFAYEDNLLAAKVDYQGYHNGTSLILPTVYNQDVSYTA